jgi:hypothetical protein
MSEKEAMDKKQSVLQVLSLLAPSYKINFTPRSLIFSKDGSSSLIDESNFDIFQDYIK